MVFQDPTTQKPGNSKFMLPQPVLPKTGDVNDFDAYSKELGIQTATGSERGTTKLETGFFQSASFKRLLNFVAIPFRLGPLGIEFDATIPTVTVAAVVPGAAPAKVGDIYVNTATGKVYISAGTASSGDWKILN